MRRESANARHHDPAAIGSRRARLGEPESITRSEPLPVADPHSQTDPDT